MIDRSRVCDIINEGFKEFKPVLKTTIKFGDRLLEYINPGTGDRVLIDDKCLKFLVNIGNGQYKIYEEEDYTIMGDIDLISFMSIMMTNISTRYSTMGVKTNNRK